MWDGNSFKYLSLNLKNAGKITSTGGAVSPVDDLRFGSESGSQVSLTVGSITADPVNGGRNSSMLNNTSLRFNDKVASNTLASMLITPTAHNGSTPAYLTFSSPAQKLSVGHIDVRLTGIAAPTADNDAVNRGYLTTKYGSTYYSSTDNEFYLPSGSKMVMPNTNMGRLFIGSEGVNSTDFKIYVNDPIDDGKLIITNLKAPSADNDAANKAYVDTKQDKFATVTTADSMQTVKIGNDLSIITSPNFQYSQISSSKILSLSGGDSTTSYVQLSKTKLIDDFDATQGYLRVRDDPLADDFAVNKKYVENIKTELLEAITHPYTYDETTKELTLIL